MPLYEYQCDKCGDVFELIQKFADPPLTTHDKCGGGAVHRLISAPALQFKGSGWYVNDYAKGSGAGMKQNSGEAKKGDSSSDSSSDSSASKSDSGSSSKSDSGSNSKSESSSSSPAPTTSGSSSDTK